MRIILWYKHAPSTLMSIWNAVTPLSSPATLKSMSPKASSLPRMSVRTTKDPSGSRIRPIATPATIRSIGTPASSIDKQPPERERERERGTWCVVCGEWRMANGAWSSWGCAAECSPGRIRHRHNRGKIPTAYRCHGRRPVGLGDRALDPDGVGELALVRYNRDERALGEVAVTCRRERGSL